MPLTARNVMTSEGLVTAAPHTSVLELEKLLLDNDISGVPVINDKGDLIGVVSQSDIIRSIYRAIDRQGFYSGPESASRPISGRFDDELRTKEVWEIMQTRLHTVTPDKDISTVAKILRRHHIHRVLVVDDHKLVGVITSFDLLRPLEDPELVRALWGNASPSEQHFTPFHSD